MALIPKWIRTNTGHAGRTGYIVRCPKGEATKFKFVTYDLTFTNYSNSVGDLKAAADEMVTSNPHAVIESI